MQYCSQSSRSKGCKSTTPMMLWGKISVLLLKLPGRLSCDFIPISVPGQLAGICSQSPLRQWLGCGSSLGQGTPRWWLGHALLQARGGRGWGWQKGVLRQPPHCCLPSFVLHLTVVLCLYGGTELLPWTPLVMATPHSAPWHCLWAASSSHLQVLSSKPQASAPSPHLCRWTSIPGWELWAVDQIAWHTGLSLFPACTTGPVHCIFLYGSLKLLCPHLSPHWLRGFPEHEKFTFQLS